MSRLSATDAARNFAAVLSRAQAGEEFEVVRSGAPVALIGPARPRTVSAARFRALLADAPPPDPAFAAELRALRRAAGPPEGAWPS
jgi:prevent-host-death family protein